MKSSFISWNHLQRMVKDSSYSLDYEIELRVRSTTDQETNVFQVRLDELATNSDASPPSDQIWLVNFEQYILANLDQGILSVPELADTFAMSESTLLRQVKRLTGFSPIQYINQLRIQTAQDLLDRFPDASITQIAAEVGYKDARSFSRRFKATVGVLPSQIREN